MIPTGLKTLFFALVLLPNAMRADMLISMMDYQGPIGQTALGVADTMTNTAVGAATVAGIYQYGKRSGYKQIMQELEIIKGQNEVTHEKIQKIMRELNEHSIKLGDIKNKQADHSYDLNEIRKAIERVDRRVDTANIKLDQVHDTAVSIEGKTTAIDNRTVTIENRTAAIENRAVSIENKATAIEHRTAAIENKTTAIENRAAAIEHRAASIEQKAVAIEHKTIAIEDKAGQIDTKVSTNNNKLDKLQKSVDIHRAGQIRQTQATHDMLRGIARILGIMHEESRSESRQILTALGQTMAKSKFLRLLLR